MRRENPIWMEDAVNSLSEILYVTIDIDCFYPALRRIVVFDVVEVIDIPGSVVTPFLAAKLVYKLIALIITTH